MTKSMLFLGLMMAFTLSAHASQTDICSKKAEQAMDKYFDKYVDNFRQDAENEAKERGEEDFNEDDLPQSYEFSDLQVDSKGREVYSYEWSERQECMCGVSVVGTLSKDGKSCKSAKVDPKTFGCDCG